MKKIFMILAVCLCVSFEAQTRNPAIYKNVTDFVLEENPISLICNKNKKKVKVGNFFLSPYLFYQTKEVPSKIHLDSIYGFTDINNDGYRICNRKAYKMCESGEVLIYCQTDWIKVKKHTSRGYRIKDERKTLYFFSRNYSSSIYPLTQTNLYKEMNIADSLYKKLITLFPFDNSLTKMQNSKFLINQFLKDNK